MPDKATKGEGTRRKAPGALKQFWWDMLPKWTPDRFLPRRSGFNPATPQVDWITEEIAEHPDALDQTRRAHDLQLNRVDLLEQKGATVVTLCLGLLTAALAVGGYQLGYLRRHDPAQWWLLVPAGLSVCFLVLATISGLEIQRVGVYQTVGAEPLGTEPGGRLGLVREEEVGRRLAQWSAGVKVDGLLQTRAWLSRALVALIAAALVAIVMASAPHHSGTKDNSSNRTRSSSQSGLPARAGPSLVLATWELRLQIYGGG
jgi:hypothetical protein